MNERTPNETPRSGQPVPDPHAGEPAPPSHEGKRPEADPAVVRPEEDEPEGIIGGLLHTARAEVKEHYTTDSTAADDAHAAGVEEEGLESGQLFGLMLATAVGVVVLIVTVYFLFYSPKLEETREDAADVPSERYEDLRESRAAAAELLGAYAINADSTYRMPIDVAMRATAADYATRQAGAAPAPGAPDPTLDGLSWLTLSPAPAVRQIDEAAPATEAAPADGEATPDAEATDDAAGTEAAAPA
ncbi:MAG TPA: hypothetical protein VK610_09510, partial [Rhodothermales bacterium]|nr:hypothetical protein [Rhodothermales bacterium]